jgi:SAM-dependent methyltransferase
MRMRRERNLSAPWLEDASGFRRRQYQNYESYVAHQRAKLDGLSREKLEEHAELLRNAVQERVRDCPNVKPGAVVLCLAARFGGEVRAFIDLGCFAVGIDLNPGPENRYVLTGDFHDLQFADRSVDVIYTNSLDHVLLPDRLMAQITRVLKPGGVFIADVWESTSGDWESLDWKSIDLLISDIEKAGFRNHRRSTIPGPWPWTGEHLRFVPGR